MKSLSLSTPQNKTHASLILQQKLSRRQLIQTGVFGTAILSAASTTSMLTGCAQLPTSYPLSGNQRSPYKFLTKDDISLISAILPAVVGTHWPQSEESQKYASAETLMRVDTFISRLGTFNMEQLRKLFDLLEFRPTRFMTTGIWTTWDNVTISQARGFLQSWQSSSFSLLTGGYNALTDVIGFSWYSNPKNTQAFGYSGPPKDALDNLPQFKNPLNETRQNNKVGAI